jgi:hypothetical protein
LAFLSWKNTENPSRKIEPGARSLPHILAEKLVLAVKKQDSNNIVGLLEK